MRKNDTLHYAYHKYFTRLALIQGIKYNFLVWKKALIL